MASPIAIADADANSVKRFMPVSLEFAVERSASLTAEMRADTRTTIFVSLGNYFWRNAGTYFRDNAHALRRKMIHAARKIAPGRGKIVSAPRKIIPSARENGTQGA